jgi:hypothetical protein
MRSHFKIRLNKDGKFSVHQRKLFFFWPEISNKRFVNRKAAEAVIDSVMTKVTTKRYVQPETVYEIIIHESELNK